MRRLDKMLVAFVANDKAADDVDRILQTAEVAIKIWIDGHQVMLVTEDEPKAQVEDAEDDLTYDLEGHEHNYCKKCGGLALVGDYCGSCAHPTPSLE